MRSGPKLAEERISRTGVGYALISALSFSTLGIFAISLYDEGIFRTPDAWRGDSYAVRHFFLWIARLESESFSASVGTGVKERGFPCSNFPQILALLVLSA